MARVICPAPGVQLTLASNTGDFEYLSWFGYRPDGTCPTCGGIWTDVMFAYDGPCCPVRRVDRTGAK